MFWTYSLTVWQIETRPCGKAEPSNILALFILILLKYKYLAKRIIALAIHLFINRYSQVTAHHSPMIDLLKSLPVKLHTEAGETYQCILLYFFLIPLFLLVSIVLTLTNTSSACLLTSAFAKSIREHMVQHSHPAALGFPDPCCHCIALYQIQSLPHNRLRCHLDYPRCHSSLANFHCVKSFLVRFPHHFVLDHGWFFWFGGHLIVKFILERRLFQTMLVAKVIIPTIWMSPHDLFRIRNVSHRSHLLVLRVRFLLCRSSVLAAQPHHQNVVELGHSVQCVFHCLSIRFVVGFFVHRIQWWVITCQYHGIGSSKLSYNDFFAKGIACGYWLPSADHISPKVQTGVHSDTMWYDRENVSWDIREIRVLWVRFLVLSPSVGDIRYPKFTANFHWVRMVFIEFRLPRPQFFRDSGGGLKESLTAVRNRAAWSHRLGVISVTLLGIKYSSSSLVKLYGSKIDSPGHQAIAEGKGLLLGTLSGLMTCTRLCLA